ncbi:hypothetical protein CSB07_00605 [Candidatus Gracilibacteria bacterium]|nr:MAG: hypothetical protein CSB07_00605 [Candidatus Gracilibacteria bacterium]PIE85631.1 MAG: hypothetical protein CSA08_01075 [Candidatus Gracilibacteria bacterium]
MGKYIKILFGVLFLLVLFFSFKSEYFDFHEEKKKIKQEQKILDKGVKDFSLEKTRNIDDTKIYYTPYGSLLEKIVKDIKSAQKRVFVEVYILTEKRIVEALKNAKIRGVDVRVILEKNLYKANNLNNKAFNYLKKNNVNIIWSNPENYSLNHTKLMIIDSKAYISTGNFTHSSFFFNRDFFIYTKDKKVLNDLEEIFLIDFQYKKNLVYSHDLVLSPNYSREKFEKLFSSAEKSLKLYFQYIKDKDLEDLLIKKSLDGVDVEIVVSQKSFNEDREEIDDLRSYGIKIYPIKKYKMHSKAILVDEKYLFIGSINFSTYSIDKNREIGILLKNEDIIKTFVNVFNQDFEK